MFSGTCWFLSAQPAPLLPSVRGPLGCVTAGALSVLGVVGLGVVVGQRPQSLGHLRKCDRAGECG